MKKRHLRKSIRTALQIITWSIVVLFSMIADCNAKAIPVILAGLAVVGINQHILEKFS